VASAGASPGPGAGRETRDPGATCARLLDPAGTRAHVPRRRAARIVRAGATGAARPAKPRARREAAAAPSNCVRRKPQRTARRGPARDRRRRRAGAQNASPDALARLLDPAATRALATPAVRAHILRVGSDDRARPAKPLACGNRRSSRARGELRVVVPPEIDGAARARRSRALYATRAPLLDPAGTRAHALPRAARISPRDLARMPRAGAMGPATPLARPTARTRGVALRAASSMSCLFGSGVVAIGCPAAST
jgi:hypothetical protein